MTDKESKILLSEDAAKAFFRAKRKEGYEYAYYAEPYPGEGGKNIIILSKHIIEEIMEKKSIGPIPLKLLPTEIDPIAEYPKQTITIYQIRGQDQE
jgi:hypothetical protein